MPSKDKKLSKKRKEKKEKKRLVLLDHLEREVRYGNVTRRRQSKHWRDLLVKIELERIREDLEYAWHIFEWGIDVKDCIISRLMDELNDANQQYLLTVKGHNEGIGNLLSYMQDNLDRLHKDFSKSLFNMENYYNEMNEEYKKRLQEMRYNVKTLLYQIEITNENNTRDRMTKLYCLTDLLSEEATRQREICAVKYDKKMIDLLNQSRQIYVKHHVAFEAWRDYQLLELSDLSSVQNLKKISNLVNLLKKLNEKLYFLYNTDSKRLNSLIENQENFAKYLLILKRKLFRENSRDCNRIKILVSGSEQVLDRFRIICTKGELLIRMMSVNRRYETVSEKILPFPIIYYPISPPEDEHESENKLYLFYRKMAAADFERLSLFQEKKTLLSEQMKLKKKLVQFCRCLDLSCKKVRSAKWRKTIKISDQHHSGYENKDYYNENRENDEIIILEGDAV